MNSLRFQGVTFAYAAMTAPLLDRATFSFDHGWTGIVGANGAGKTTLLKLATGELTPSEGSVVRPDSCQYVVQRTDLPPANLADFFESCDAEAWDARIALGIEDDWETRWDTLSHGERKRLQIAIALWHSPEVLALDEPTNHLDAEARAVLVDALRKYRGTGLLVSHDRALLDELCAQCLFVRPPHAQMRPGGVTAGMEQDRREQVRARAEDDAAKHAAERFRAAAQERREAGERMAARTKEAEKHSKNNKHDHDGKEERRLAKMSGKDQWAGKQASALLKRAAKANKSRAGLGVRKEFATGVWLEAADVSKRDRVMRIAAGELPLGEGRVLRFPDLEMAPDDRVAITGANGLGKSTFLRHVLANGILVEREHLVSVPQEITAEESEAILKDARTLGDTRLGEVMTAFSRLGSRPGRLLESAQPSPGEVRKLLLALGLERGPHLIVMDEPTNHLDLPGILCLEDALADSPCALLLVSHDDHFLERLATREWHLAASEADPSIIDLRELFA